MLTFALKPVCGPSLVLFSLLISVSVNINKADELSWCDQDADIFSLMQSENIGQNLAERKAYIGASSVGVGSRDSQSANITTNVEALLPNKESRQSLVQRVSNKYQVAVVNHEANFGPWLAVVICSMAAVFCIAYCMQISQDRRGHPDQKGSKLGVRPVSPPSEDSWAGSPLVASNSNRLQSPKTVHDNQTPHNQSPRLNTSPRQVSTRNVSLSPDASLTSAHATPPQTKSPFGPAKVVSAEHLVPSLANESGEIRVGVDRARLASADGHTALDIVFKTGQPYLRVLLEPSETRGYHLTINTAPSGERACSIVWPASSDPQFPYQILNAQGSQHGSFYCVGAGSHEVVVHGGICYTIRSSPDNLRYQVLKENETVAFAQANEDEFPGGEHMEFRVLPGTDAVLIVGILIGMTLFSKAK